MRPTTSYGTAGHGPTGLLRKTPAKFPVVGSTVKTFRTEPRWPCQTAGCRPWAKDPATDTRRRKKAATMRYIFSPPDGDGGSEWYFVMGKSQGCWRVLVNGADQTYRGSLRCLEEACDVRFEGKANQVRQVGVAYQVGRRCAARAAVAGAPGVRLP